MAHKVGLVKYHDVTDGYTDVICVNRNSDVNVLQNEAETFVRNWAKMVTEETISNIELDNFINTLESGETFNLNDYEVWIEESTLFDGLL